MGVRACDCSAGSVRGAQHSQTFDRAAQVHARAGRAEKRVTRCFQAPYAHQRARRAAKTRGAGPAHPSARGVFSPGAQPLGSPFLHGQSRHDAVLHEHAHRAPGHGVSPGPCSGRRAAQGPPLRGAPRLRCGRSRQGGFNAGQWTGAGGWQAPGALDATASPCRRLLLPVPAPLAAPMRSRSVSIANRAARPPYYGPRPAARHLPTPSPSPPPRP